MELMLPYEVTASADRGHRWLGGIMCEGRAVLPAGLQDKNYETDIIMFREMYEKGDMEEIRQNYFAYAGMSGAGAAGDRLVEPGFPSYHYGASNEGPRNFSLGKDKETENSVANSRRWPEEYAKLKDDGIKYSHDYKSFRMPSYEANSSRDSQNDKISDYPAKQFVADLSKNSDYRNFIRNETRVTEMNHVKDQTAGTYKIRPGMTRSLSYTTDRQAVGETGSDRIRNPGHSFSPLQVGISSSLAVTCCPEFTLSLVSPCFYDFANRVDQYETALSSGSALFASQNTVD